MSERFLGPHPIRRVTAVIALVAAGCSAGNSVPEQPKVHASNAAESQQNASHLSDESQIERCFDEPQPHEKMLPIPPVPDYEHRKSDESWRAESDIFDKKIAEYEAMYSPPELNLRVVAGALETDPITLPDSARQKAQGAVVKISLPQWSGTGFLTQDSRGNQLVVTAAHVVGEKQASDVHVTDNDSRTAEAVAGCYIYESGGRFSNVEDQKVVEYDVAALRLSRPIGKTTLQLSVAPAARGEWVEFMNFQEGFEPGYPADYLGLITTSVPGLSLRAITGLQGWRQAEGFPSYSCEPGMSGGPVINAVGDVVATSTSSGKYPLSNEDLTGDLYDVNLLPSQGPENGILPVDCGLMKPSYIAPAISAMEAR